jgi:predicted amidohydrolase
MSSSPSPAMAAVKPTHKDHTVAIDTPVSTSTPPGSAKAPALSLTARRRIAVVAVLAVVVVGLLVGLLAGLLTRSSSSLPSTYRAVAIQYLPYSNSTSASVVISLNLEAYTSIVAALSSQAPFLVAFPEGGLGYLIADEASTTNATATHPFCESIPPPSPDTIPCLSLNSSSNPQLTTLSCLAKQHAVSLVVNLCQVEPCAPGSPPSPSSPFRFAQTTCPPDGFYYWSSNVVLSPTGALSAVYPKAHLFDTLSFDTPVPSAVTWSQDGITFGTMVAFDIEFTEPGRALLLAGVQHVVWTGWWSTNQPPQLTSVMIQQAWAERWGVNPLCCQRAEQPGIRWRRVQRGRHLQRGVQSCVRCSARRLAGSGARPAAGPTCPAQTVGGAGSQLSL